MKWRDYRLALALLRKTSASLLAALGPYTARSLLYTGTLVGCGPHPPAIVTAPADELPPPNPRVPTTDEDRRACERLSKLGCSEAPKCLSTIADARTDHVPVPSACIAAAADVAAVRRCGDKGTLTFSCP